MTSPRFGRRFGRQFGSVAVAGCVALTLVAACSAGQSTATDPSALPGGLATPTSSATPISSGQAGPTTSTGPTLASPSGTPSGSRLNVYAAAGAGMIAPVAKADRALVYVPDSLSNTVSVIDPHTFRVISTFRVGALPQHVVPSWDLKTLWVNDNHGNSLVPIDPRTGKPGKAVPVEDPYNLYFSPDGAHAMVMAEALGRIDFRDPHTMRLQHSLKVPCRGVNHADFTADLKRFLVSCEFSGKLLVIPADGSRIEKVIDLNGIRTPGATDPMTAMHHGGPASSLQPGATAMPQDVRLVPDGSVFVAADMLRNGIWVIDATTLKVTSFLPTGKGAHGVYPSRDGTSLYVSNRDEGSVSVVNASTLKIRARWTIPGGGSPDMGGVSADGKQLWLSGRSHGVVYVFDTGNGHLLARIRVGDGPHGLCLWPQPGRFSLGHTGNLR